MMPFRRSWLWRVVLIAVVGVTCPVSASSQTYIRFGVLLDGAKDAQFRDKDCSSQLPKALYGCGMGNDQAPLGSAGDFGTITGFEAGLGYAILPALRLETAIQYRPDFSFKGGGNFTQVEERQSVSAELSVLSGMLATYLDVPLPGLALLRYTPISPFIGVGGGVSRIDVGETRVDLPKTSTLVPGNHHVSFSWMLSAGVAISLSKWTVDVAWRYTDHGAIETGMGGRIVCRAAGNCDELDLAGLTPDGVAETTGDLRSHGFALSLRYSF